MYHTQNEKHVTLRICLVECGWVVFFFYYFLTGMRNEVENHPSSFLLGKKKGLKLHMYIYRIDN